MTKTANRTNRKQRLYEVGPNAPSKSFFVRVYTLSDDSAALQKTVETATSISLLEDAYRKALQQARRQTLLDGQPRRVEIEQCLVSTFMQAEPDGQPPMVRWKTKWLLMAEIDNEEKGGASPATLESALDSVRQGYNPDENNFAKEDMEEIEKELMKLAQRFGGDCSLEHFITIEDWRKRAACVMS